VARVLHGLYPGATIRIDSAANAIIVIASPEELSGMRSIVAGIDVRGPASSTAEAISVNNLDARLLRIRLAQIFRRARFGETTRNSIVVTASAIDMAQIKAVIATIDAPTPAPTRKPAYPTQALRIVQADPRTLARAVARSVANVRVMVAGSSLLLAGPADAVTTAKALASQLDLPAADLRYATVYRLRSVDASSVAAFLSRSFPSFEIETDRDLNSISVVATTAQQQRISDAVGVLDATPGTNGATSGGNTASQVVALHAAVPSANGNASTSANDIAQTVLQAIGPEAPDLKITVQPNSTRLILSGSSYSIERAKALIAQLDVPEPLVELDTNVYEVDEGIQKQLGLKFPTPVLSTTYSELTPSTSASGEAPRQPLSLQGLTRTPLTLGAELDFLVATNQAKILEDPRITTFSGRTASIRAGESVNILTTAGGGSGTVATTQIQSFQTGVTLDITPVVNADGYITVTLHPSVNSEAGVSAAGVPNIQTRDTTTTVGLHDGETLVVGGLIEENDSRTVQKIPLLGDLPLIGRLFQDVGVNHTRNELIVTVTPHILRTPRSADEAMVQPTPGVLPTIDPRATLPQSSAIKARLVAPAPSGAFGQAVAGNASRSLPGQSLVHDDTYVNTAAPQGNPVPAPLPSALDQANTYTYGSAPANNYAQPNASPQILFLQVQPTIVKLGQAVTISAITTTNVTTLRLGASIGASQLSLGSLGAGKWHSSFPFSTVGLSTAGGPAFLTLTASTGFGASASLQVPFSVAPS
jgi:type II secretory pathway component GspD/PulD (secretin)